MISGIFGKTKPINYILLLGFLFVFYWFTHFYLFKNTYDPQQLALQTLVLLVLLFSVMVINFVVNRNQITSANSYTILYFTLLIIIFPKSITDNNAIVCNLFLLLSCRRLISLKSLKYIKLKILDATLWVLVASLFYDWAILFLILVLIAIYIYEPKNIKNWLVPLIGIFTFMLLVTAVLILRNIDGFWEDHYTFYSQIDTSKIMVWEDGIKLLIYIALGILTGVVVFLKTGKMGLGRIINLRVVALFFAIGIMISFLKLTTQDYPVLITFFPAAVFMAKYVEIIKRKNIKELVLAGSFLVSFIFLITEVVFK
jgi:hypothetical protein